ncbi:unnamed protein product [Fraxinus pennsylvanica]|uniref:Uncharacterized protein n=1 Tax=Fraxinus pennsylvanica TaxID=56036 RepID=A0AAD1ZBC8_9LAMI|nr:unnamed protein product [Fraxinus pennsylvanica]
MPLPSRVTLNPLNHCRSARCGDTIAAASGGRPIEFPELLDCACVRLGQLLGFGSITMGYNARDLVALTNKTLSISIIQKKLAAIKLGVVPRYSILALGERDETQKEFLPPATTELLLFLVLSRL